MRDPRDVEDLAQSVGLTVWPAFLERVCCDKKEIYLNGGWRGGKSNSAAFIVFLSIVLELLTQPGKHLVWLVASDYKYTVPEFNYILDWAARMGLATSELSMPMQGARHVVYSFPGMPGSIEIETKSAEDPTSLGGRAPDILLACEAGLLSEEARFWILGRTAEKNSTVIWSGTFENDEGKQQFAWFEEESQNAWDNPNPRRQAFRLPTWGNRSLYSSCLLGDSSILKDPSLAVWCPDSEHGPAHSELNHPMIRKLADQWKDRPNDWRKRFGGEPVGLQNMVYEWAALDRIDDLKGNKYLVSMSEVQKLRGPFLWTFTGGGIDPGLVHPAGIAVSSLNQHGDIWARDARRLKSSNNAELYAIKDLWTRQYRIPLWGGDPVGLRYSRPTEQILPMTGTVWSREERAAIINSYAIGIDNQQHLYFDADNREVRELFAEYKTIHRKKRSDGQWGYNRDGDDMVAAHENSVVVIHSRQFHVPDKVRLRPRSNRPYAPMPARDRI